jgi:hypothetical protein
MTSDSPKQVWCHSLTRGHSGGRKPTEASTPMAAHAAKGTRRPGLATVADGSKHEIEGSLSGIRPQLPLAIRQAVTLVTGHPRQ